MRRVKQRDGLKGAVHVTRCPGRYRARYLSRTVPEHGRCRMPVTGPPALHSFPCHYGGSPLQASGVGDRDRPGQQTHIPSRSMNLDEYQSLARRTMGPRTHQDQLANAALGLTGEAGEVADMLKKHLFHAHPLDRDAMVKELGDCMWYVAAMATALDIPLSEIGERNIEKLRKRYPEGFSAERSLNRVPE